MTSELLILIAGAVVSLLFSYFPALNTWFAGKAADVKRLIMVGVLFVISAVIFGLSCAGFGNDIGITIECSKEGALGLLKIFIMSVIANQSAYAVTVKTPAVKALSE